MKIMICYLNNTEFLACFINAADLAVEYGLIEIRKKNFIYWGLQCKTINLFEPQELFGFENC
jgi:hypothetical protein